MERQFKIGNRECGEGCPAYITAEIGLNHGGDVGTALRLIDAAAESGADAVKFQIFKADSFVSSSIRKAAHQKNSLLEEQSVWDMWKRLELSPQDVMTLTARAGERGVCFYASPFDEQSVDLLARAGAPVLKIASGEVTNLPLIEIMAATGLPLIMSVGMASLGEIEAALDTASKAGCRRMALLHCVANYPAESKDTHLARISELKRTFGVPAGYSDHTIGPYACVAAAALGATFLEKHFTLDRRLPGTDHVISADPGMMREMVTGVRIAEEAIGSPSLTLLQCEEEGRTLFRRGLVALKDIPEGVRISPDMIGAKRPATGIEPGFRNIVIGRAARRRIPCGSPVTWDDV